MKKVESKTLIQDSITKLELLVIEMKSNNNNN